jgi:lipopolysaccharide/colanic/teichoic acid biosynthesis glycosyltransferase
MLKFRTAVHDPERPSRSIWDLGAGETRLGRFLRYSRIEDLPQLINVLRGEMTLIGQGIEARNLRELAKLALWAAAAAIFGMLVKEGRFLELLAE